MKIGHPTDKAPPAPSSAAASGTAGTPTPAATPAASAIPSTADASAKIALSSSASALLSSDSTPEFDAAKVERMSKSIENGTYSVNHGAIADKLIANAHEVLAKVSS